MALWDIVYYIYACVHLPIFHFPRANLSIQGLSFRILWKVLFSIGDYRKWVMIDLNLNHDFSWLVLQLLSQLFMYQWTGRSAVYKSSEVTTMSVKFAKETYNL